MYNGPVPSLPERNDGEDIPVVIPTDRYVIKFAHRNSVFLNSVSKTLSVVSEPEYSVSSGRIYSSVKVGYAKQDYDLGNNGKDEFNSTIEYSTGLNLKEQTLDFYAHTVLIVMDFRNCRRRMLIRHLILIVIIIHS